MSEPTARVLDERVQAVPALLSELLSLSFEVSSDALRVKSWDVVGVGASEAPARLAIRALWEAGLSARLVSISTFLGPPCPLASGRGLLIFSQGLSPNAQLALAQAKNYQESILVTAVTAASRPDRAQLVESFPGMVLRHPPEAERGTLVRLLGPPCAALVGLLLCAKLASKAPTWEGQLAKVPSLYKECLQLKLPAPGIDPAVCLAVGEDAHFAPALMWKWQEALYTRLPVAVDVLAFVHGPLQALYNESSSLLLLCREGKEQQEIWERLGKILRQDRHRVVSLMASLPGPLAYFEYDALVSNMLVKEVALRGIDPRVWPAQGQDGALYSLCARAGGYASD